MRIHRQFSEEKNSVSEYIFFVSNKKSTHTNKKQKKVKKKKKIEKQKKPKMLLLLTISVENLTIYDDIV